MTSLHVSNTNKNLFVLRYENWSITYKKKAIQMFLNGLFKEKKANQIYSNKVFQSLVLFLIFFNLC